MAQKVLPPLSLYPPDSLIACYRDQLKQSVLNRNVDIISSETVRNSHVRGGGRLLLQGIPSSEEERRLPLSDRPFRSQRVVGSSDFHDGHSQSCKGDG